MTTCSFAYVYMLILSGKYLLFYLLQRGLIDGTLHRLLLDGLHHWTILGLLEGQG